MDSRKIEFNSIIKLKNCLSRNEFLYPNILDNDKTPSWDGDVEVYNGNSTEKKEDLMGLVRTQVKGKKAKTLSKEEITFSVNTVDLNNYLRDGGVLFFVVYMLNYDEYKIYYKSLLTYDLTKILKNIGSQKTKTIKLDVFPEENLQEIKTIFYDFLLHKNRQISTKKAIPDKLEEVSVEMFDNYSIYLRSNQNFDLLFNRSTYIYGNVCNGTINIPISKVHLKKISINNIKTRIKIKNKIYFKNISIHKEIGKEIYCFGECIKIDMINEGLSFLEQGTLNQRIEGMEFIVDLLKEKNFYIDKMKINIPNFTVNNLDSMIDHLKNMIQLRKILNFYGVHKDLEYDQLSESDENKIKILRINYEERKVEFNEEIKEGVFLINIADLSLFIRIEKIKNFIYKFETAFSGSYKNWNIRCHFNDENFPVSLFILFKQENFEKISNIDYSFLIEDLTAIEYTSQYGDKLNETILEMLKAYDNKNDETLLEACIEIAKWLKNKEDNIVYEINYLQVIIRKRELSKKEIESLYFLRNKSEKEPMIQFCIAVLLGNINDSEFYLKELEYTRKKEIVQFPIWNIYLKNKNKMG